MTVYNYDLGLLTFGRHSIGWSHPNNPEHSELDADQNPNKKHPIARSGEVLDVHGTAALLMVSADTVYDLFSKGELPGRKVRRKWITTKAAVLRWIESSSTDATLVRAIEGGDTAALKWAINKGTIRVRPKSK